MTIHHQNHQVSLKVLSICLWNILIVVTVLGVWSSPAWAIPAFSRKYDLPCSACHVPSSPKLNDFGNVFRDHGYQLGSEPDLPTFEALTKGYWPVSLRTTVGYQSATLHKAGDGTPGGPVSNITTGSVGFMGLDILSFGILDRDLTYGVVFAPSLGSGEFGSGGGESDLEFAFVKLDNLFHSDYILNLKVGKYELDLPASEHRSPTINTPFVIYHYMAGTPYTTVLGNPGLLPGPCCPAQMYANPNDFELGENQPGVELSGMKETSGGGYFRYSLNALSNSGLNAGGSGGGRAFNFYGRLTQSLGGYGAVSGQRIGVFGMHGQVATVPNPTCTVGGCGAIGRGNQPFSRVGGDISLTAFNQLNLIGTFMHANDSKELFVSQGIAGARDATWNGAFVELDYNPMQIPAWLFGYRYDLIRNVHQGDPTFVSNFNDVDSHTVMARYNFLISTRVATTLHAEYNYFQTKKTSATSGDQVGQTVLVGLDFSL